MSMTKYVNGNAIIQATATAQAQPRFLGGAGVLSVFILIEQDARLHV